MASEAVTPAASPAILTVPSDGAAAGAFVGAIDQGTTSTRFIIFDREANVRSPLATPFPRSSVPPGIRSNA